jgi:hypothetical protein
MMMMMMMMMMMTIVSCYDDYDSCCGDEDIENVDV